MIGDVIGDVVDAVRAVAVLAFLLVGPGLPWARLLDAGSPAMRWSLVLAVSLAVDTLVATTLLYAGMWSPALGLVLLLAVSAAGVVAGRARLRRRMVAR